MKPNTKQAWLQFRFNYKINARRHVKVYPNPTRLDTFVLLPKAIARTVYQRMLKGKRFTFNELLDIRDRWYEGLIERYTKKGLDLSHLSNYRD